MTKTVLVTGGDGALGKILAARLRAAGNKVVCTGRSMADGTGTAQLDVSEADRVLSVFNEHRPGLVFHLAATFDNDFDQAYATNVQGAQNLLAAAGTADLQPRVILLGSAAEYGLVQPEENPIREDRVLRPVSVYGVTKSWQTSLGVMAAQQGLDVVIARVFNLDGPGLSERLFAGRVARQMQELVAGVRDKIEIGSLTAVRDYINIDDAVTQLLAIAQAGKSGEVYHVASGKPVRMREFLTSKLASYGYEFDVVNEMASLSARTGYDVPVIYADMTKTTLLLTEN